MVCKILAFRGSTSLAKHRWHGLLNGAAQAHLLDLFQDPGSDEGFQDL